MNKEFLWKHLIFFDQLLIFSCQSLVFGFQFPLLAPIFLQKFLKQTHRIFEKWRFEMGLVKDFVEILAREKWAVYLFMLWGGARFFWGLGGIMSSWTYGMIGFSLIGNIFYLGTGLVLVLFGWKLLRSDFLGFLSRERLFAYFLLLWGGSSFFFAVDDIIGIGTNVAVFVAALFYLLSGVVLALLGYKLLMSKDA